MRRILYFWSVLTLTLVLGAGPLVASVPSGGFGNLASIWSARADESRLPACCRKRGKHHCAMGSAGDAALAAGETVVLAKDCCPFSPRALDSTAPSVAEIDVSAAHAGDVATRPMAVIASSQLRRGSERRNWPKRGPPATQIP